MAGTGLNNGFYFDPEVFGEYMQEQPKYDDAIIVSGIVEQDEYINRLLGAEGNVGTMPFYKPLDVDTYAPKVYDGVNNNTPNAVSGGKQSFMLIKRMNSWSAKSFTKELTGAKPIEDVANKIAGYEKQVRKLSLMSTIKGISGVSGFANHITDISITTGTIADANKISAESAVEVMQKACGDMAGRFSLAIMNSAVLARLKILQLIDYVKYTDVAGLTREVTLPTYNGMVVIEDDRGTVDTKTANYPVYTTIFAGRGLFRGADQPVDHPYHATYDPEKFGGVDAFYEKQAYVLHPNGFSIDFANIAGETPTDAELATTAKWSLGFDEKVIPLAILKSNG